MGANGLPLITSFSGQASFSGKKTSEFSRARLSRGGAARSRCIIRVGEDPPLLRPCLDCGRPCTGNRCATHQAIHDHADNQRRHAKQKAHGRTTAHWQALRQEVITRDQGRCRVCGKAARTVHLDPSLHGNHSAATAADCILLCAMHHGHADGRRSNRGGGVASRPDGRSAPRG